MTTSADSGLSRSERLDRLPFTREHGLLVAGSGIGWALDAMDVGLISFVMAALAVQWGLDDTTLSWVASIGFVGMAIGAGLGNLAMVENIRRAEDPAWRERLERTEVVARLGRSFGRVENPLQAMRDHADAVKEELRRTSLQRRPSESRDEPGG
jgi:hypothetical protein